MELKLKNPFKKSDELSGLKNDINRPYSPYGPMSATPVFEKPELPPLPPPRTFERPLQSVGGDVNENLRAKVELILTEIDTMKIQLKTIDEKLNRLESYYRGYR